jgi:Ca2+-transporting ATPase
MLQFWNMFNAKAYATGKSALCGLFSNTTFLLVAALIIVGQILIVSFGGEMFRVSALGAMDWLIIIAVTSPIFLIGELKRMMSK